MIKINLYSYLRTNLAFVHKMIKNKTEKMYIPALSISAVVLLLLMVIAVSTYRNLDRDRRTIISFLDKQGLNIFRTLEIGIEWASSAADEKPDIQTILGKVSEIDNVAYVYITSSEGVVIYHSGQVPDKNIVELPDFRSSPDTIIKRIIRFPDNKSIYEMIKPGFQLDENNIKTRPGLSLDWHSTQIAGVPEMIIILGILMTSYEESLSADLHHAIIMAAILLVLGSGLIFFIFVIQNYYLVDKTLKQTQDYTRLVIANMANGLISIDNSGMIVSYNKLALDLLDLREAEAGGTDLKKIIDFEFSGISEALNNIGSSLEREISITKRSGENLPLSLSVSPLYMDSGQVNGAVIILRDLREIKHLEEKVRRSEKLAAIGKLAAGVAHEIRNPLSSIKGFAQFLRHVLKDRPEESEYANVMVHEIDRINRVVSDLLIYSKPFEVKLKNQNLYELIDHTILLVKADARAKKVNITKKLSENMDVIRLDPNKITHALLNLLLNSLEAVPEEGHIMVGAELIGQKQLNLWVEDDGYGIPADCREKVMDPFFTTRDKGTGLGLAIVHKIVENHNGEIMIESPPKGKTMGTKVSMFINIAADEERGK